MGRLAANERVPMRARLPVQLVAHITTIAVDVMGGLPARSDEGSVIVMASAVGINPAGLVVMTPNRKHARQEE